MKGLLRLTIAVAIASLISGASVACAYGVLSTSTTVSRAVWLAQPRSYDLTAEPTGGSTRADALGRAAEDTSAGEGTLYHRHEPDPANQESIRDIGRLYGTRGQYGDEPAVRAYRGPAPSGDPNYIQFETNAQDLPPYAFFRPVSLGVETEGGRAFICVFNVKLGGEC